MRMAVVIEPGRLVDTDRIHDQSIFVPFTDRVSVPGRLAVLGERPAVGKYLAIGMVGLEQYGDEPGNLNDFTGSEMPVEVRHAVRKTTTARPVLGMVSQAFLVKLFRPGLHRDFSAARAEIRKEFAVGSPPYPRKIRSAVGKFLRGRLQVRFSLCGSRNAWIAMINPLRACCNRKHDEQ